MKLMRHECVLVCNGPQISECTILISFVTQRTPSIGKFSLCCLLCMQDVHKEISLSSNVSMLIAITYI